MFERYTEKARRVVFFARYEASQFGSPCIEAEHLLLGLLREDTALAGRLSRSPLSPETLRKRIEEKSTPRKKVPPSIDLPLSSSSKSVLTHAAEEAERFQRRHIGTEHLLLGLVREENTLAAKLLTDAGFNTLGLREELGQASAASGGPAEAQAGSAIVEVRGRLWDIRHIRDRTEHYKKHYWERRQWMPRDALVRRADKTISLYTGQPYDLEEADLVKDGWSEDHCVICWWKLFEGGLSYTNGQDWLCSECCEKFVTLPCPVDRWVGRGPDLAA